MGGRLSREFRRFRFIATALAILLLHPGLSRAGKEGWMVGLDAVGFAGVDLLEGRQVALADHLKSRVVLLEFASIYSSASMAKMPALMQLRRTYTKDQLAIYNVNLDITNPQRVLKFYRSLGVEIGFPVLVDRNLTISRAYQVETLPTTVIIDRDGLVVMAYAGHSDQAAQEVRRLLAELINGGFREEREPAIPADTPGNHLVVYTPESFTKTSSHDLHVVGAVSGESQQEVFYKLNNQPERHTVAEDGVFHFRVDLALAMNVIEVRFQVAPGQFVSESLVVFREAAFGREFTSELPPFLFHQNEDQKPCLDCHRMQLSAAERNESSPTTLCRTCHGDLLRQTFSHGPIVVGGCLSCHDQQSGPARFRLKQSGRSLCQNCHADTVQKQNRKNVHGPVAAGACTVCHDPHGSSEKYRLRRSLAQLCLTCHANLAQEAVLATRHPPFVEKPCTVCHSPHASDNELRLLQALPQLCTSCHAEVACLHRRHVGTAPPGEVSAKDRSTYCGPAGVIGCTSCHDGHASAYPKLVLGTRNEGACAVLCHGIQSATNAATGAGHEPPHQ